MKKTNYFYIDETGHVNNDSKSYMYGCLKTDSASEITNALERLKTELAEDLYLQFEAEKILTDGFHAVDNHFDVRASYYKLLPFLNVRAFFVVMFKETSYYEDLKSRMKDFEIIEMMLEKLIVPRILKNKGDRNIFIVENLDVEGKSQNKILDDIFGRFKNRFDVEYEIKGKDEINLSTVDYFNYNLIHILNSKGKPDIRATQTFEILKKRIALIYIFNNDSFYSRKAAVDKRIEVDNLKNLGR